MNACDNAVLVVAAITDDRLSGTATREIHCVGIRTIGKRQAREQVHSICVVELW